MQEFNDKKWIEQALKGNSGAYSILVNQYKAMVFALCFKLLKNRESAEELAMDTFLKAFRALGGFRFESKFSSWLYRIAYTSCMSHLRIKQPLTQEITDWEIDNTYQENDISQNVDRLYKKESIQKALNLLSPEDASLLHLYYLMEQSLSEIEVIMNLPVETLKVRLFRARKKFKTCLNQCSVLNELL